MSKKLEDLRKKRAQLDERIKDAQARENAKDRRFDTRKKIILGGALLGLLKNPHDDLAGRVFNACKNSMSEKDRTLFDN